MISILVFAVTFSFPGLSHIKGTIASNKEEFEASMKEMVQEAKVGLK